MAEHPVVVKARQLHDEAHHLYRENNLNEAITKLQEALDTGIRDPFRRNWIAKDLRKYRREKEQADAQSS